jgi:hypothetical protein
MTAKTFFSRSQLSLTLSVLDRIIPPNAKMPGAGEAALGFVDEAVGNSSKLRRLFHEGLAFIEITSCAKYSKSFANLSEAQRDSVLRSIETEYPKFFDALVRQTYDGYYTNPRVIETFGLEVRPPQPGGFHLADSDLGVLEKVKQRGRIYRDVSEPQG